MATKARVCPCCGQVIPPEIKLPSVKQRVYDTIRFAKMPMGRDRVMEKVYGSDADGGPDGLHILSVHIYQINTRYLRPRGLEIHGSGGPGSTYSIRKYAA